MANREPKKDFAASHGMTHGQRMLLLVYFYPCFLIPANGVANVYLGSFRDYLKTHGEAKSSEQLATERAVADARAKVIAQQKVSGRVCDVDLLFRG
jgi:hypothetical protein